ncbi:MAG: monovalent cation/H(+) antiporter subunit G [Clostridia bacterium]|nr:monovalent cation/H(+) antiporter subunit G [Clostridia bacterium]
MIEWIRFILTALLMIAGLVIFGISTLGVFRFKYAVNRMHAAAMGDTLGVGLCLVGLAVSAPDFFVAAKILMVVIFFWLSAPVSSHLLCRLEIETNERLHKYMTVHEKTLAQEREEKEEEA